MKLYHQIVELGARLVLSGSRPAQDATEKRPACPETPEHARGKVPLGEDWLKCRPPTGDAVIAHLQRRGFKGDNRVGFVPGSLGLLVVDVDDPNHAQALFEAVGPPLLRIPSRHGDDGRFHAYYKKPPTLEGEEPLIVGNSKWQGGELRCDNGFVVLWGGERTVKAILGIFDNSGKPIAEQWPSVAPIRLDAIPDMKSTSRRAGATLKFEIPDEVPDPLDDEALDGIFELIPSVKAAFYHDKIAVGVKTDDSMSGWDATLSAQGVVNDLDDELIIGLLRIHNLNHTGNDKTAQYYYRTLATARAWVIEQRAEVVEVGKATIAAEKLADILREDSQLEAAVNNRSRGLKDRSNSGYARHIAKLAIQRKHGPEVAVALIREHRTRKAAEEKPPEYYGEFVQAVMDAEAKSAPIDPSKDDLATRLGIEGFKVERIFDPESATPPRFRLKGVEVGDIRAISREVSFRDACLTAYKKLPPAFGKELWPSMAEWLAQAAVDVHPDDPRAAGSRDENGETREWVEDYLSSHDIIDVPDNDLETIGVGGNDGRRPFMHNGTIFIFSDHMAAWLSRSRENKIGARAVATRIKRVGWTLNRSIRFGHRRQLRVYEGRQKACVTCDALYCAHTEK